MVYVMARTGSELKVYENVRRSCNMKIRGAFFVVMILLACLFLATAEAQQYTVTKVVVIAKPSTYTGPCPATIEFLGTIFVGRPAIVEYRWERSDGVMGPRAEPSPAGKDSMCWHPRTWFPIKPQFRSSVIEPPSESSALHRREVS